MKMPSYPRKYCYFSCPLSKNLRYTPFAAALAALLVLSGGCSTKKNTVVHRAFHNLTSHFNGYFYAKESVKEGLGKIEQNYQDDYSKLLPVFIYPDSKQAQTVYGDMDKAIKKASLVIQRHCITDKKGKEIPGANKWIDDNYMVIGKSHFYKRDFFSALESFDYVSRAYKNMPARFNGMLWQVRTYNELGSLSMSEPILASLKEDNQFPKNLQKELAAISADFYIKSGSYEPAIKELTKAVTLTKKKKARTRYTYILAQLYEMTGDKKKASQYYGLVIGLNPASYDMTFNARISRARLYDATAGDSKDIKKELQKMLKDDKNIEYFDQVYYALAEIAEKEKDMKEAVKLLNLSVRSSVTNTGQKARSFLKLADISFTKADYKNAQAYYDSTVAFLPKDHPEYNIINTKKQSLTALVQHINTITAEDSLQKMARMSEKDRDALIAETIKRYEAEEKRKEEEKLNQQQNNNLFNNDQQSTTVFANTNSWYFYNPSTVSFGIADFNKKWGNRKLEDNWRRSAKEVVLGSNPEDGGTKEDTTGGGTTAVVVNKISNKKTKEYYLQNVPLTPEAMKASNDRIVEAYYSLGSVYKEQLADNKRSAESFEEMMKRYEENKYKLQVYYQLYRLNLAMKDNEKANYYKNIFLTKYPDSEYAKIIRNPEAAKDALANRNKVEQFYTETFEKYKKGEYADVIARGNYADSAFGKNELASRFAILRAMSIGRTQDVKAYESALTQIIIKYPKDEVKDQAQYLLDVLNKKGEAAKPDSLMGPYQFDKDADHMWVIIIPNGKGNINKFKIALSDLNGKFFSTSDLKIESMLMDNDKQLVTVKNFAGTAKAMDYYNFVRDYKDVYKDLTPDDGGYQRFIISSQNFSTFYKEKKVNEYMAFFKDNFLK